MLHELQVAPLPKGVAKFHEADAEVISRYPPEPGKRDHVQDITDTDVQTAVAFALEALYRVWTHGYRTVDHAREMDAEERQSRFRDRVNQVSDNVTSVAGQPVIFASVWDDTEFECQAHQFCHPICLQAGTGNKAARIDHCAIVGTNRYGLG